MTRAECVAALEAAGIPGAGQRAYHLLWYASQKGVTCVGPQRGKEQTFVLLDEFAPPGPDLDRPSALAVIAERFVRSHAPVSAHDLARWADLTVTDARAGLAAADGVVPRTIGGRDLFVTEALLDDAVRRRRPTPALPARALPGFDEFVLGYRDRTAQLDADHERLVVPGGNGVFANTLVLDGHVVGTWRRRELARTVDILASPFARITARDRRRLARSLDEFATFVGKPSRISWSDGSSRGAAHLSRDLFDTGLVLRHRRLHGHDGLGLGRGCRVNGAEVGLELRGRRVHLLLGLLILESLGCR